VFPSGWPRLTITYVATPSASAASIGFGCNGHVLGAQGLPKIGNPSFALSLAGATPGATAYAIPAFGVAPGSVALGGGCSFDLDLASAIDLVNGGFALGPIIVSAAGGVTFPAPIPPTGPLHGLAVEFQVVSFGAAVAASNVVSIVLGS
jgi:hypothetical protein